MATSNEHLVLSPPWRALAPEQVPAATALVRRCRARYVEIECALAAVSAVPGRAPPVFGYHARGRLAGVALVDGTAHLVCEAAVAAARFAESLGHRSSSAALRGVVLRAAACRPTADCVGAGHRPTCGAHRSPTPRGRSGAAKASDTSGCWRSDHVRVAIGRNYLDAAPTSGTTFVVVVGGETLSVEVRVEPHAG